MIQKGVDDKSLNKELETDMVSASPEEYEIVEENDSSNIQNKTDEPMEEADSTPSADKNDKSEAEKPDEDEEIVDLTGPHLNLNDDAAKELHDNVSKFDLNAR